MQVSPLYIHEQHVLRLTKNETTIRNHLNEQSETAEITDAIKT